MTGSVNQTDKTQRPNDKKPAPVSQAQLTEVSEAKVKDEPEEWAEVSLAAKVHSAPSVSAPTVRYYRVGTRPRVIGREPGWIKVVDPTTSKEGWIYEKYLAPKEGPDQKQVGTPQSKMPDDMNVSAPDPAKSLRETLPAAQIWLAVAPPPSAEYRFCVWRIPQMVNGL